MKKVIALIAIVSSISIIIILSAFQNGGVSPDSVYINDAVRTALEMDSPYETVHVLRDSLTRAFEDMETARQNRDNFLRIFLCIFVWVFALSGIGLCLYCQRIYFTPFHRLEHFAHRVAAGNLDIPLEMDKHNLFGAFTESFDLMREELRTARENEYKANQSKKELAASLSHDIKTPVASIMSAMDIMLVKAKDEKERKIIESVNAKLEQINTLVTNMFHAAIEELQVLKVTPCEIQSSEIPELIQNADYNERLSPFSIPDCIVLADSLRLQQVFDNIIHNSYKYAGTDMSIRAFIHGGSLILEIQDFGSGVLEEEVPFIFNKFYRGSNAGKSDGCGLGLYLSRYFTEQMSGRLYCENRENGFAVMVMLRLAGKDEGQIKKEYIN